MDKNTNENYNIPSTSGDNINLNMFYNNLDTITSNRNVQIPSQSIVDETNRLYFYHLAHEVTAAEILFPLENINYFAASPRNIRSLRGFADQFVSSPRRRWVHDQVQNVDLESLSFHTFQQLLFGLFQESGVTWERVLVLFYFCSDLSIRALQEKLIECFIRLYNWTTFYIISRLSVWIEQEGGWDVILQNSVVNYAAGLSILGFCCIGILVICIYLRNNK